MSLREKINIIIFESNTPAAKAFDVVLIISIFLSVVVVMADSINSIHSVYGDVLYKLEWLFTILFSIEYIARLFFAKRATKYVFSFYGIIDLFSIIPTYFSFFLPTSQYLSVIRILRVLRIFRVLKLSKYLYEYTFLIESLVRSRRKIMVFIFSILSLVVILGSVMYVVEGAASGFDSIPHSIYWAIVTLTTVGYGDITPITALGKLISAAVMILGYAIIAVPAGLITSEMINLKNNPVVKTCSKCFEKEAEEKAKFCKFCGSQF